MSSIFDADTFIFGRCYQQISVSFIADVLLLVSFGYPCYSLRDTIRIIHSAQISDFLFILCALGQSTETDGRLSATMWIKLIHAAGGRTNIYFPHILSIPIRFNLLSHTLRWNKSTLIFYGRFGYFFRTVNRLKILTSDWHQKISLNTSVLQAIKLLSTIICALNFFGEYFYNFLTTAVSFLNFNDIVYAIMKTASATTPAGISDRF